MKRQSISIIAALILCACAPRPDADPAAISAAKEARKTLDNRFVAQTAGLVAPVFQACADYAGAGVDPKAQLIKAGFEPAKDLLASNAYQRLLQDGSRVKMLYGPVVGTNLQRGCQITGTAPSRRAANMFYALAQTSVQSAGYQRQALKSNWYNKGNAEITVGGTLKNSTFVIRIFNSSSIFRK